MTIEYKDIKTLLSTMRLKLPNLNVLAADAHAYEVLAIQPTGEIELRDDFIGHANRGLANNKFLGYLKLAQGMDSDLVLAPEYSVPWDVLKTIIQENKLPRLGKLWILGCESITPHELREITSNIPNIIWIHEPIPTSSCRFLNVLAYVFKTKSNSGPVKDVIILQFKTQAMADVSAFERDRLIEGKTAYLLHNEEDRIRLVSLICSESLVFEPGNARGCRFDLHPFIVFHPQLVRDPAHPNMRAYRSALFATDYSNRIEVFTLNWARGFRRGREPHSTYGGSAIYMKSDRFSRSDSRLDANHQKGLYYAHWRPQRTELSLFNFDEHVFHFRTQKVFLAGPAVLSNRNGPEMLSVWQWNEQRGEWCECSPTDDGFRQLCDSYEESQFDCCLDNPFTSVDRERLLVLTAGKLEPTADWHTIEKLPSYVAGDDERSKRLTFVQEQHGTSVNFRKEHLRRYIKLQTVVLPNEANFPPTIQDLRGDCHLRPPTNESNFRFNLISRSGSGQGATALFVDLEPPPYVQELRDKFVAAWGQDKTRRLVIWYEHQGQLKCEYQPLPKITDDSEPPTSIARTVGP